MEYNLFKDNNTEYGLFESDSLKSNIESTPLSDLYFSKKNVEAVHDAVRYQVYVRSNEKYTIGRQSDTDVRIVMRSIFLEWARNSPVDIVGQVRELNGRVVNFCADKILSEINMYMRYRHDISTNPEPLARSTATTSAGSKTLFMKEF